MTTAFSVMAAKQANRPHSETPPSSKSLNKDRRSVTTLTKAGHFVNGMVSSAAVIALLQPGFTVKTWIMSNRGLPPIMRLWDGILSNVLSGGPAEGPPFLFQEVISQACQSEEPSEVREFATSLLAGTTSAPLNACFERVMIRQQLYDKSFCQIVKSDWALPNKTRRIFYGTVPTMWRDCLCNLGIFAMTDAIKRRLRPYISSEEVLITASSATAGGIAGCLSTPFDCVKTHMQSDLSDKRQGMITTTKKVVRAEGPRALFRGVGIRSTLLAGLITCINFAKEKFPQFLPSYFHEEGTQDA